ncbi:MAG: trypsin-like serine protease [Polyangiaceae bacterium]
MRVMHFWYGLPLAILGLVGCQSEPTTSAEEEIAQNEGALVGGHVATESEYPATVYIGGCTGTKVGPQHFLTAAHCVNASMTSLTMTTDNNAQNAVNLPVLSVNIHPEYANCTACNGTDDFGMKPDVALVIVSQLTPNVPVATIDPNPVAVGDAVTLTGYGCENGVGQPSGPARLKVGDTHSVDPSLVTDGVNTPAAYVTTLGPALDSSSPGLCPGDSGGPLYRTGTNQVVGVNALVSFGGEFGTPFGNWHTRLDSASRYNVYAWLNGLITGEIQKPCTGLCASPTAVNSAQFASGNLGTQARCFETSASDLFGRLWRLRGIANVEHQRVANEVRLQQLDHACEA